MSPPSHEALASCLACVRRALAADGMFVFDLMTRRGFRDGDHWDRFDEFRTPTLFPAPGVVSALHDAGWARVWMASIDDLRTPVTDPEQFDRICFVAVGR